MPHYRSLAPQKKRRWFRSCFGTKVDIHDAQRKPQTKTHFVTWIMEFQGIQFEWFSSASDTSKIGHEPTDLTVSLVEGQPNEEIRFMVPCYHVVLLSSSSSRWAISLSSPIKDFPALWLEVLLWILGPMFKLTKSADSYNGVWTLCMNHGQTGTTASGRSSLQNQTRVIHQSSTLLLGVILYYRYILLIVQFVLGQLEAHVWIV